MRRVSIGGRWSVITSADRPTFTIKATSVDMVQSMIRPSRSIVLPPVSAMHWFWCFASSVQPHTFWKEGCGWSGEFEIVRHSLIIHTRTSPMISARLHARTSPTVRLYADAPRHANDTRTSPMSGRRQRPYRFQQIGSPKSASAFQIPGLSHSKVLDYLAPSFMTTVYSPKIGLFQKADTIIRHSVIHRVQCGVGGSHVLVQL